MARPANAFLNGASSLCQQLRHSSWPLSPALLQLFCCFADWAVAPVFWAFSAASLIASVSARTK